MYLGIESAEWFMGITAGLLVIVIFIQANLIERVNRLEKERDKHAV